MMDIAVGQSRDNWVRIISSNEDWDNDGVATLSDASPLDPARQ